MRKEPFSSPVFGVVIRIIATPTKICTAESSTLAHASASSLSARPPTTILLCRESGVGVAPSIFGTAEFGRYVATRFLADADFYGHRPTVKIQLSPSWFLCPDLWPLIPAVGSSLFANPAYQDQPTSDIQRRLLLR